MENLKEIREAMDQPFKGKLIKKSLQQELLKGLIDSKLEWSVELARVELASR